MDKPNARELLKEVRDLPDTLHYYYPRLFAKIDAYLAASNESAMETVRKIREEGKYNDSRGKKEPANTFALSDTDAAALVEGLQRRVPKKVLEALYLRAMRRYEQEGFEGAKQLRDSDIEEIAKWYSVKVEG